MKGQLSINVLMALMIALIIGIVAVVPVIIGLINTGTTALSVAYDPIACVNQSVEGLRGYLVAGTFSLYNRTNNVVITSGNYTLSTATYGQYTTVTYSLKDVNPLSLCKANYSYFDPAYQTNSTGRTVSALIPLMVGIILIMTIVGYLKFK